MIAPAVIPKLASAVIAIPIITVPIVPTEPQEVPVKVENITGIINASRTPMGKLI